jgi:FhaA, N-terminal domain/FHA domain
LSVLRTIEQKIEALVEGVFGRAFRTNVQPVELARKLVKEMDDHRTVSVSRVYVPNEYTVYLSPHDRGQFQAYEESLRLELQEYLAEHARREGYVMLSPPAVLLATDDDLGLGVFGIATRMVQRGRTAPQPDTPKPARPSATMIYRPEPDAVVPDEAEGEPEPAGHDAAHLIVNGERHPLDRRAVMIGRSQDCDIQIADPNISRRHAEVRQEEDSYSIVDLGSTNGLEVNGKRVRHARLEDGDTIVIGSTEVVFERDFPADSG